MFVYLRKYFIVHCRDTGFILSHQILLPTRFSQEWLVWIHRPMLRSARGKFLQTGFSFVYSYFFCVCVFYYHSHCHPPFNRIYLLPYFINIFVLYSGLWVLCLWANDPSLVYPHNPWTTPPWLRLPRLPNRLVANVGKTSRRPCPNPQSIVSVVAREVEGGRNAPPLVAVRSKTSISSTVFLFLSWEMC